MHPLEGRAVWTMLVKVPQAGMSASAAGESVLRLGDNNVAARCS
jgi:hypothetical protein